MNSMPMTLTRSILTLLVPGVVAVAPWLVLLSHYHPAVSLDVVPGLANVMAFGLFVIVGATFEGLGSFLEASWDTRLEAKLEVKSNWIKYLARQMSNEPVGYRYVSRLVTTMYFELAMVFAVPLFFLGAAMGVHFIHPTAPGCWTLACVVFAVGGFAYFWWQARTTHELLCTTRKSLNEAWDKKVGGGG